MNIITNHVKGVQAGFQYPINQEVTKNADGSGGTIYKQTKKKSWYDSFADWGHGILDCLLYTSPSPRDLSTSRMPSSA